MENIILVGYMGSGKSTVGQAIAAINGYMFVDTDAMIEDRENRTIGDIFAGDGEQAFRDMETELLRKMLSDGDERLVISTGGGMVLRRENRELLNKLGTVIYLEASAVTIYERLKGDTTRPLLQCDNPKKKIEEMINMRGPIYEESATISLEVSNLTPAQAAEIILKRIEDRKR